MPEKEPREKARGENTEAKHYLKNNNNPNPQTLVAASRGTIGTTTPTITGASGRTPVEGGEGETRAPGGTTLTRQGTTTAARSPFSRRIGEAGASRGRLTIAGTHRLSDREGEAGEGRQGADQGPGAGENDKKCGEHQGGSKLTRVLHVLRSLITSYSRSPSVERIKLGESEYKTMLAEQQAKRRAEINEKRKNRRESSLEARERRVGARGEVGSVKWMQEQLFEVELVLRQGINCEDDLHYTLGAAEAGLLFMDQIEKRAKEAGVTKGALSRFVLPFDSETYVTDQAAPFKKSGLSTEGSLFEGKISDRDLNYLVKGANSMRRLVRIKVADDNDLETAAAALKLTSTFLNKCVADAKRRGLHDNIYNTLYKSLREGKGEAKINELYPLGE